MSDTKDLTGAVSALLTPFHENQDLNRKGLRELVQYNLRLGISAFYVCGSTGEGFLMTTGQRKEVVEITIDEIGVRAGVIVNVSHMTPEATMDLAAHAARTGADAISTLPPLYYPLNDHEVNYYYQTLLDECDLPMTVYNIPVLSHKTLPLSMAEKLAEHEKFIGIKHSSSETGPLNAFKQIADGRLKVWSGCDDEVVAGLSMGSDGAIGTTFNLAGDLVAEMIRSYRNGEIDRALQIQTRYNACLIPSILKHGAYRITKRALTLAGVDAGVCRRPFAPLDPAADASLREALGILDEMRKDYGLTLSP
jgi:N-acetylneuraminate lyase